MDNKQFVDRSGNVLCLGQLVLVPMDDYSSGQGHWYSMGVGRIIALDKQGQGDRGDMVTVHTKWEPYTVRCDRVVSLKED